MISEISLLNVCTRNTQINLVVKSIMLRLYNITILCCFTCANEGESALSVSAFYGWLDCVKRLVEIVGLNPKSD